MKRETKVLMLIPEGNSNKVFQWMRKEVKYRKGHEEGLDTATQLAEEAADAFGRDEWLEDSEHWIWDAAAIVMEENNL